MGAGRIAQRGYAWLLTALFGLYRRVGSPLFQGSGLGQCRYLPTCSEYAEVALLHHGAFRGSLLAAARLLRCHPWAEGGFDPVPSCLCGEAACVGARATVTGETFTIGKPPIA